MNDKKSEAAATPEPQPEPASAAGDLPSTVSKSKSPATAPDESSPAPPSSRRANGAAVEKPAAVAEPDQSLGTFLIAARERRGLTAEDVARETRLPAHYLRMMETNDYSEISDQLYLVPFLRRYAGFLDLDQEDVAMRFVREVQRADSIPPARLDRPLVAEPRRRRGWAGAFVVIGVLAVVAAVYLYETDRHRQATAAANAAAQAATGQNNFDTNVNNINNPANLGTASNAGTTASTGAAQTPASH